MKLTYTVQLDLGNAGMGFPKLGSREDVSAAIMREAFDKFPGHVVAGCRLNYLTIWPHDDSHPSEDPEDVERGTAGELDEINESTIRAMDQSGHSR